MQKGSAQLIAGPLGVGSGVRWGETLVGGGGASGSFTPLPQIWRSGVSQGRVAPGAFVRSARGFDWLFV